VKSRSIPVQYSLHFSRGNSSDSEKNNEKNLKRSLNLKPGLGDRPSSHEVLQGVAEAEWGELLDAASEIEAIRQRVPAGVSARLEADGGLG